MDIVEALRHYLTYLLAHEFSPEQLNDLQKQKDLDSVLHAHLLSLVPGLSDSQRELVWRAALGPLIEAMETAGVRVRWLGGRAVYFGGSQGVVQQGNPDSQFQLVALNPDGLAPQTLGRLIADLTAIRNAESANRQNADRAGVKYGETAKLQGHLQVDFNTKRCMDRLLNFPGVAEMRMLCDWKQFSFLPESLKTLRADLCLAECISPADADALTVSDVAARLQKMYRPLEAHKPAPSRSKTDKVVRDRKTEARDKWIYEQCYKGAPHDRIVTELRKRALKRGWKIVSSKQRIQQIGNEYADAHGLDRPPSRQNL